jgi:hypothetical protein
MMQAKFKEDNREDKATCKHYAVERDSFFSFGYVIKCINCGKITNWKELKELWR